LHRRGVEAAACEARQCSVEDVIAPGALSIWLEPGHVLAGNLNKKRVENRMVVLFVGGLRCRQGE